MGKDLILSGAPSDPDLPTQSDTPPQRREPLPFSSLMDLNGPAPGGPSLLKSTSSGDAAKALVEAWQGAAMQPATASNDGDAFGGGGAAPAGSQPTAAEMELRAQLELATARCTALEEQNSVLWQDGSTEGVPFPDGHSPTVDGAPRMPVPPGEDVAAVLALAPPELRQCETVVAMERLIGDRDEELAFLRERCVQFEVEVEAEFEDLSAQLFEAQQKVHELQQSLTESEAKRRHMVGAKQMLEGKLQDAGVQLMECERQLAEATGSGGSGSAGRSPKAGRSSRRDSAAQVEKLKEENNSLMEELVAKKMALAELSENHSRLKRDLHRRSERDKAVTTKMSRIHAIMNGTAPLNSLQMEKGHLLANSPSAASLSRRLSQGGASMSSADGSLSRLNSGLNSGRPSSSSGGAITPYKPKWDPDRDFVRPWR